MIRHALSLLALALAGMLPSAADTARISKLADG